MIIVVVSSALTIAAICLVTAFLDLILHGQLEARWYKWGLLITAASLVLKDIAVIVSLFSGGF